MATREELKQVFANGQMATGEKFANLIDSMKVVQLPVVDPQALGTSLSFIDSISQDADGKITATKKTLDLANAHELNPFKGWYKTGDTLPTDGFDGAYLYFKDTSELTGQTTIYRWNGTTYADTGTVVDTSNVQTFATGQAVNEVKIKDENGEDVTGPAGVLSAEAGANLNKEINGGANSTIVYSNENPPNPWSGKTINTSGEIVETPTGGQYKLTPPISLNKGDSLIIEQRFAPAYGAIFIVDENITTATRVADASVDATYTATEDCLVAAQVNVASSTTVFTVTKSTPVEGLAQKIGDLSELTTEDKSSLVDAINEVKEGASVITVDGVPTKASENPVSSNGVYEALHGKPYVPTEAEVENLLAGNRNSSNNGWNTSNSNYKHTAPIHLSKGDKIEVYNRYNTAYRMLWRTDAEGTTYTNLSGTSNMGTVSYTATEDCYVVADLRASEGNWSVFITPLGVVEQADENKTSIENLQTDVENLQTNVNSSERILQLGTDFSWITGSYTGSSGTNHTSPIFLKAGETIVQETQYSPNQEPAIAAVSNVTGDTSYNTGAITIASERFEKNGVSWYRNSFTAKYDMYVCCSSVTTGTASNIIKIVGGSIQNILLKADFSQKSQAAFEYLPKEYDALRTKIDSDNNFGSASLYQEAMRERQVMISEVAQMDKEDSDNIGVSGYVPHVLTEGKCGYMPGSDFATDPTDFVDDTIHWKLYDNGILYISGYGRMYDFVKGVSGCLTKAQIDSNYPLSGNMWYYNIPLNDTEYTYPGEGSVTYHDKKFLDQSYGDSTNPINNKPYGYAAPWYIYRAETDMKEYVTESSYYGKNPNKWYYDRICIVEDTSNSRGGITYIGNWNFYRNTCETLVLPEHVTKIGAWGVRYSTTMKYLYMGDLIAEIEDHGVSRNESLEYVRLSSALSNIWLNGLRDNALKSVSFRGTLTDVEKAVLYDNNYLVTVDLNGAEKIGISFLNGNIGRSKLIFAQIGEGCTEIASSAFTTKSHLVELTIPSTVTLIGTTAFDGCTSLRYVTVDSESIAALAITNIATSVGGLYRYAEVVRIPSSITDTGGIEAFFSYVGEKDGYKYYIRIRK